MQVEALPGSGCVGPAKPEPPHVQNARPAFSMF
jgi:hypothetical protein